VVVHRKGEESVDDSGDENRGPSVALRAMEGRLMEQARSLFLPSRGNVTR